MTSDEIRETFLSFFEQRDHLRLPSAPLIPATYDPSVLLTTAGMHPLKPYFLGREQPPHNRLTSCQKCFRTVDIEVVGTTTRHETFFEMLGNFSIGDYFKQGAAEYALELSLNGFGLPFDDVWITVFEGDEELGLGPDEEAIEAWLEVGIPRERIVLCPRSENFWQAGPTGPCGPCSELYLDRGVAWGREDDLPGGDNERFLEYWNLVFMQYDQQPENVLTPLPFQNIDTGLGLERMAAIKQDVDSVFDTDNFRPLMELGEELSGRRLGENEATDRALRVLADHSRGMTFLIADGVVPSNEDRGYVLRRVMRRAVQRGRSLGMEPGFLSAYAERVRDIMASVYPELYEQREAIDLWVAREEEGFGRTLEQGTRLLDELIARARETGAEGIASEEAFRLHDTYGFPIDLTLELVAEHGLGVDEQGFEALMDEQRERSRTPTARAGVGGEEGRRRVEAFAGAAGFRTEFVGYETVETATTVGAVDRQDGHALIKLAESPFYPAGGGQISDSGVIACEGGDCRAVIEDVFRLADDQAVAVRLEEGELRPGERVIARVDTSARHATEANHTATHLLHAALRMRLGGHVRQAGSYVGPDKLRFDFTHAQALTPEEVAGVEDLVNAWVLANHPVRALTTTLEEARGLGAMALFGEKYGDVVRMVEVGDGSFSRELCGGTHVRSTAEIGVFVITQETSSAANVRRIEAITGPEAVSLLRRRDAEVHEIANALRTRPDHAAERVELLLAEVQQLRKQEGITDFATLDVKTPVDRADHFGGVPVLVETIDAKTEQALLQMLDTMKGRLPGAVIVLGAATDERVFLVASVAPELVERGLRAGDLVKEAATIVGGGGGGRDTIARAGGRDPTKLDEALVASKNRIASVLEG